MVRPNPRVRFTVDDYMSTPEGTRYQLLDGEMILAPSPSDRHQTVSAELFLILRPFIRERGLGRTWAAPFDVIFAENDVSQPDILFVSNARRGIVTAENIHGAPDLVVEVSSPSTERYDRGYKMVLYGRFGVREYWIADPIGETIEVFVESGRGLVLDAGYSRGETLMSRLLPGLAIDLEQVFSAR